MVSRIVTVVLLCLLAITHAQLWLGAGSMDRVAELHGQINELPARGNDNGIGLAAEVDVGHVVALTCIPLRGIDRTAR